MKWDTLDEEPCSLSRTVAVVGDRWTLLILRELIQAIWRLKPVPRQEYVDVQRIFAGRHKVKTLKGVLVVSDRMNRIELGSVEKAAGSESVRCHEPTHSRPTDAQTCF